MRQKQKEYLFIIGLVAVVAAIGFYTSYTTYRVKCEFPTQQTDLQESDFLVKSEAAEICVGREPLSNLQKWFGEGQFLGMSTIYEPPGKEFLIWFTKSKIPYGFSKQSSHVQHPPGYSGRRSSGKSNQSLRTPLCQGQQRKQPGDYDLQYGITGKGTITFRMHHDGVSKLVITRDRKNYSKSK